MDTIRRVRKSRSSSNNKIEGNQQIYTEKNMPKLASPSVVGRLMGLDGLPAQQPIHRQTKSLGDNNIQTARIALQRDARMHEGRSYKKSSPEQTEFKDVYEDTTENSACGKDLMLELLQQPDSLFVKHLRGVQGAPSGSLCNHIAVLKPSNSGKHEAKVKRCKAEREASKKYDKATKQIHEDDILRYSYGSSHGSQKSRASSNNHIDGRDKADIVTTKIVILKPNYSKAQSAHNSFPSPCYSDADLSDCGKCKEITKAWTKEEVYLGKIDFPKDVRFSSSRSGEARKTVKKTTREMRGTTGHMMNDREAREAAKKFNRETVDVSGHMMVDYPSCGRHSPGTVGLYDFSGIDSASESEVIKMTSWDSRESFVSREAKKKLLERWKMAHKYQDAGVGGKGSTLGEMLSVPDMKERNLDAVMAVNGTSDGLDRKKGSARWDSPLGISSRDGWKDRNSKLSSRLRSLPPPPTGGRSVKPNAEHEARIDDKLLMPNEVVYCARSNAVSGNFNETGDLSSKSSRSGKRKLQSSRRRYASNTNSLLEIHLSQDQMKRKLEKKDSPEEQPIVPQTPRSFTNVVDAVASIEHGYITMSRGSSAEFPPELSTCNLKYGDSSAGDQEDSYQEESSNGPLERGSIVHCTRSQPEFSESSKEADHPSPVSVLEVPSTEDDVSSSPECFEQVSADLRELQKQLKLLKRESKAYAEAPTLLKSDNDDWEGSIIALKDKGIVRSECWELSYIVDVLIESGYNGTDPDMFVATWYSPDCPLGPWVFDNLEKKYRHEITAQKYERKLLFDRINSAFLDISRLGNDPCPWVRPVKVGTGLKWQKCGVRDELRKLLAIQEKETQDITGKLLDKEMQWLDSKDFIDMIGTEVEKLMIDDLINELVIM